jgi:CxxC motif-containing protein (DUF1111 family)
MSVFRFHSLRLPVACGILAVLAIAPPIRVTGQSQIEEAPAGFDNNTNGFVSQGRFTQVKSEFERRQEVHTGLGPVYNAAACVDCHASPVSGGISQITELFAGRLDAQGRFVPHPGGGPGGLMIHSRATDPAIQETLLAGNDVRAFRTSLNTLGDGFVECIEDSTLIAISEEQAAQTNGAIRGEWVRVPVLEAPGVVRVGRFGWKCQVPSLQSFAAGAYLFEMGITSPLQPVENSSNGRSVAAYDPVPDPEDDGEAVLKFATFIRATKTPPRDAILAATPDAAAGEQLFTQVGCGTCHRPSIVSAPPGTLINGGTFTVPPALGDKTIHPFGDFLLHDVGTGDGIPAIGPPSTRNKLRTAPLWGVRTRNRLMHDGESLTFAEAIRRHQGEAAPVTGRFLALPSEQQQQLITFLQSL